MFCFRVGFFFFLACGIEALEASVKEVICSSRCLGSLVGVREAEAVLESFNEDFAAFELLMSSNENSCCV